MASTSRAVGSIGSQRATGGRLSRVDPAVAGLVALLTVTTVFLLHQGRGTVFYFDEWNIWAGRYGADPDRWLGPVNGHLSAVPILIFTAITKVFGAEVLDPFRVAVVACHLALLTLAFVVTRRRIGGGLALAAVAPLSVVSGAWLDFLMPWTGLVVIGPLVAALGAYLCLERNDRAGDIGACVLLTLGMATAGGGLAALVGFGVYLLLAPGRWRRLWVPAVPLVLYMIWRAAYDVPSEFAVSDLGLLVSYLLRGLASGAGAYTTLGDEYGLVLAVALVALALATVWRDAQPRRALSTFAAIGAAYWALIAFARGPELGPEEVRYVYMNAVMAFLIALALVPILRVASTRHMVVAGVAAILVATAQVQAYRQSAAGYRDGSALTNADLFAYNTAAAVISPDFKPPDGDPQLDAGPYLSARRFWGGPSGFTEREVQQSGPKVRDRADTTLARAYRLAVGPVPSLRGLTLAAPGRPKLMTAGLVTPSGARCWKISPGSAGPPAAADVLVPPRALGGIVIAAGRSTVQVRTGRYHDDAADEVGSVAPATTGALPIPPDGNRAPWKVRLTSEARARVCGLAR